jgi:hypothetical protein
MLRGGGSTGRRTTLIAYPGKHALRAICGAPTLVAGATIATASAGASVVSSKTTNITSCTDPALRSAIAKVGTELSGLRALAVLSALFLREVHRGSIVLQPTWIRTNKARKK